LSDEFVNKVFSDDQVFDFKVKHLGRGDQGALLHCPEFTGL